MQQPGGLSGHRGCDRGVGVAKAGYSEPGEEVQVPLVVRIPEVGTFAADELDRRRPIRRHQRASGHLIQPVEAAGTLAVTVSRGQRLGCATVIGLLCHCRPPRSESCLAISGVAPGVIMVPIPASVKSSSRST